MCGVHFILQKDIIMTFLLKKNFKRFAVSLKCVVRGRGLSGSDGVRILMYHSIGGSPDDHPLATRIRIRNFEAQLGVLAQNGYKTVTISELVANKSFFAGQKVIAITFDDGYKDAAETAVPILRRFGLKATFFITTSHADGECSKRWANGSLREYMNWPDIAELSNMGFEIGSHMVHHVNLTDLYEEKARFELKRSKEEISDRIGREVEVFSYPYGGANNRIIKLAKEAGYVGGCSSCRGRNYPDTDPYILRRTEIDGYDTMIDFNRKLSGLYD